MQIDRSQEAEESWKILGVESENLKRYIAVMSVLRGYPRVAAIILLVQYQRQYISHSMKYHVLSERVRQRDVVARRVSFAVSFWGMILLKGARGN